MDIYADNWEGIYSSVLNDINNNRLRYYVVAFLGFFIVLGILFQFNGVDLPQSVGTPGAKSVISEKSEDIRLENALAPIAGTGNSKESAIPEIYSEEEQKYLKDTSRSFREALKESERKRASFLWGQKQTSGWLQTIHIEAPSVEEIGEIARAMGAALDGAPARLKPRLRLQLQKEYNAFTNFSETNRVLYITWLYGVSTTKLLVREVEDISSIKPSVDGSISLSGKWVEYSFEANNISDDHRYLHILRMLPPIPPPPNAR